MQHDVYPSQAICMPTQSTHHAFIHSLNILAFTKPLLSVTLQDGAWPPSILWIGEKQHGAWTQMDLGLSLGSCTVTSCKFQGSCFALPILCILTYKTGIIILTFYSEALIYLVPSIVLSKH